MAKSFKKGGSMTDAGELFGLVKKIKALGGHQISREVLSQPLENKESVAYYFCRGCGAVFEVNKKQAEQTARKSGLDIVPKDFSGYYFEAGGCEVCDGDDEKVSLKQKP